MADPDGGTAILVSGLGADTEGGLYTLFESEVVKLAEGDSTGLAVSEHGRLLARLLWSERSEDEPGEILVYDQDGLRSHNVVPELRQGHSVLWSGEELVAVSTGSNAVLWLDGEGSVLDRWQAPGDGDFWHLNSLLRTDGELLVSAFGRFDRKHGWLASEERAGKGIVFEIPSERQVVGGLSSPHNPVRLEDGWLVCNSADGDLLRLDRRGVPVDRHRFDGWPRGLAVDDELIYVGVSAHRLRGERIGTAFVAALRSSDLTEVDRWTLPCREIYDVILAPTPLIEMLRLTGVVDRPIGWASMLEVGDRAPAFTLPDQDGNEVKLSDFKGETVVLYFYPRADTPGCTTQACGIRDRGDEYAAKGAKVIGVSPDEPEAIKRFDDKYGLGFTLLGDPDHKVADKYGAWGEKSMYGKKYMGMLRSTFIIDPKGKVARVFPKVQPKKHDALVLKALDELAA